MQTHCQVLNTDVISPTLSTRLNASTWLPGDATLSKSQMASQYKGAIIRLPTHHHLPIHISYAVVICDLHDLMWQGVRQQVLYPSLIYR